MSSQPSLRGFCEGGCRGFTSPVGPTVGVKAGLVKKYLYRRSLQEKRAEKPGGGLGHHARIRMSGGSRRFKICG